MTSTAGWCTAR